MVRTNKRQLSVWASNETYNKVKELVEGDDSPFESVSEYLLTTINQDLARRELGIDYITYKFLELLDNPEVQKLVREKLK